MSMPCRRTCLALAVVVVLAATASGIDAEPLVARVAAIGMTVSDVARSVKFYSDVFGFERVADLERWGDEYDHLIGVFGVRLRLVRLRLGDETLELTQYLTPRGRPIPVDSRSNDRWFQHIAIVVSDMDRAYAVLRAHRVEHASPAPQRLPDWNRAAGGIRAFYFKDPDGHPLEIIWFPVGKGDPRWQRPNGRLFRGIDHTAIVVGDTERTLRCYRDALGLTVAGTSENYGPEQERLNNVFAARLRITTLRAQAGPGIELLEYLTPRDGRAVPADARVTDLAHAQTVLVTGDVEDLVRGTRGGACGMLAPNPVALSDDALGFRKAVLIRDPDGHALEAVER